MSLLVAKPHRRSERPASTGRAPSASLALQDVAFVLHLAARVRREMTQDKAEPQGSVVGPGRCGAQQHHSNGVALARC